MYRSRRSWRSSRTCQTDTRDDFLENSSNSPTRDPQHGPSGITTTGFAAVLEAAQVAGLATGQPSASAHVEATPTATPPDPPDEEYEDSPLCTRRYHQKPTSTAKRRKPRPN